MPVLASSSPMQPPVPFQHQTLETGGLQHNQMQKSYQVQQSLKHLREKAKEHEIELKKQLTAATTVTSTSNHNNNNNTTSIGLAATTAAMTASASSTNSTSSSGFHLQSF